MLLTKRNRPDFDRPPTSDEARALSSFSYKSGGLRVSFSKTHGNVPGRTAAWNATVHRNVGGKPVTFTVYAGTDRTLPSRFEETLRKMREKVDE